MNRNNKSGGNEIEKKKKKGRTGELEAAPETDTSGDTEEFSRSLD